MEKMKKFFRYFLMFIVAYIIVTVLTNFNMREKFEDVNNYKINVASPKITVTESKATYSHGYIKGNITNNTGSHIKDKYLQFDFYDKDGVYLGTKSQEIKYFNVNEKINFDVQHNFKNVNSVDISFINEKTEEKVNNFNIISMTDKEKEYILPIALFVGLYAILP